MTTKSRGAEFGSRAPVVIVSFNCEGWDDAIMLDMLHRLSDNHSKPLIICCQETWKYEISSSFHSKISKKYNVFHKSAMDRDLPQQRGRPFGGLCFIISKQIDYKIIYDNERCISMILINHSTLLNNG